ncbi:MAG TPA: hypothetical protein ENH85_10000 [Candidatus Scalindua sp.]|nr:hypothetical protein [Candidatus Scalindua sp.]
MINSLKKAAKEQKLDKISANLEKIVPDIRYQYSTFELEKAYQITNVRNLHAFQISLVNEIIQELKKPVIVDIGDSAGAHLQYIMGLYSKNKDIKCLSVNLDEKAVRKIREKGLEAIHARAEDLHKYDVNADIFLCFELLEHLMNPCQFLYELSSRTNVKYLIVTIPYVRGSRVGLHHIRGVGGGGGRKNHVYAENTHIFELSRDDWKLVVRHSGWDILQENVYLQYPKRGFFRLTKAIWKRVDFEGFYGLILKRDKAWSSQYMDW